MPNEGWKSITVKDQIYVELQTLAEKNCRSMSQEIEHLLKTQKRKEA